MTSGEATPIAQRDWPPTEDEINAERNPTRKAVLIAMQSLLTGEPAPKAINRGKRSVVALANEAGVGRTRLVRGALSDLADWMDRAVAKQDEVVTPQEHALNKKLQAMLERALNAERKYKDARDKRTELEAVVQALAEQLQVSIRDRARLQAKLDRLTKNTATMLVPRDSSST
ncbi:hypothetical protein [Mycobacterium sp. 360MFTsu5.1]|uniref:hypothetical protein n=1 Tax=Mycobacterium sp. 360MFTsu5.1 TaxID=1172186 RepID=UPI000362B3E5|nr:hypothetical protein [Mycobacterium sp. 360MFTsu5.1]